MGETHASKECKQGTQSIQCTRTQVETSDLSMQRLSKIIEGNSDAWVLVASCSVKSLVVGCVVLSCFLKNHEMRSIKCDKSTLLSTQV